MKQNIGTLEILNPNNLVLLRENSDHRYRGSKFIALRKSIKDKGVIDPISVGKLNKEFHVADGNRRTTASRELKLTEIPALVKVVNNRDELQEMFMDHTKYTHNLGAVQLTDMYLKGMDSKWISNSVKVSINRLNEIYKTTAKCNTVLKRMVAINKSPRSYIIALDKLVEYINTDEVKTNEYAKQSLYWMLNCGSAWSITHYIDACMPIDYLMDAIKNKDKIPKDWWCLI